MTVQTIRLPDGQHGSFVITDKMLVETPLSLTVVEAILTQRAKELGVEIIMSTSEKRNGILVSWRPARPKDRM